MKAVSKSSIARGTFSWPRAKYLTYAAKESVSRKFVKSTLEEAMPWRSASFVRSLLGSSTLDWRRKTMGRHGRLWAWTSATMMVPDSRYWAPIVAFTKETRCWVNLFLSMINWIRRWVNGLPEKDGSGASFWAQVDHSVSLSSRALLSECLRSMDH